MPLVSVVIPNFNHDRFLRQRVQTVLDQTFGDFELFLLDDASTDESRAVIDALPNDPRLRVVLNDVNSGSTFKQWKKGAALASGRYLWFAESDDFAESSFLERLVSMMEANPSCGLACSESWYVYGDDVPTTRTNQSHLPEHARWRSDYVIDGRRVCAEELIRHNTMPNASAVLIRRSEYDRVGGPDESMRLCGDWMLWVKILEQSNLAHVGDPLNFYRCSSAAVRKKNFASARTQAEVYQNRRTRERHDVGFA